MERIESDLPLRAAEGSSIPSARSIKGEGNTESGISFKDSVSRFVNKVNELQLQSQDNVQRLAAGEQMNIHDVMIAQEQANLAFQMALQLRNKILEAYQEVMRMQV